MANKFKVGDSVIFRSNRLTILGQEFQAIIKEVSTRGSSYSLIPGILYQQSVANPESGFSKLEDELRLSFQSVEDGEITRA